MKRLFRNVLTVIVLVLIFWLFTSCRSSKSDNMDLHHKGTVQRQNDINTVEEQLLLAEIEKIVHRALSEQMNVTQRETEYDTDKPVNSETGKPPVKKEKETIYQKTTEELTCEAGQTQIAQQASELTEDKTKTEIEYDYSDSIKSETNTQKESDIFFKWVGRIVIFLVVLCLSLYILRKYLKKKLHNF